ncbi:RidA family protein [Sphingomonas sp. AP4-R1]|uniref:RidA family protein n=1 Tax=Sphingomonas sp. AP4-R1 TaxID=2735134 RepID=UPI0014938842|nr:RidA family protein [Sphingomonas sp. AP4-R1]QJU59717.1 RidA family protein [Sphingomonas sp. AP4-R1]
MRRTVTAFFAATILAGAAQAAGPAEPARRYLPPRQSLPGVPQPPFSAAVEVKDTLYISGMIDVDPATGKPPATPEEGAKIVLEALKSTLAAAGYTMNELVQVQIFAKDLADFPTFNKVYVTYFDGPMPARAFIGAGNLLAGAHFEVMGIAVRKK